jgi:hypothetical protein
MIVLYIILCFVLYTIIGIIVVRIFSRINISYKYRIYNTDMGCMVFLFWPLYLIVVSIGNFFNKLIN